MWWDEVSHQVVVKLSTSHVNLAYSPSNCGILSFNVSAASVLGWFICNECLGCEMPMDVCGRHGRSIRIFVERSWEKREERSAGGWWFKYQDQRPRSKGLSLEKFSDQIVVKRHQKRHKEGIHDLDLGIGTRLFDGLDFYCQGSGFSARSFEFVKNLAKNASLRSFCTSSTPQNWTTIQHDNHGRPCRQPKQCE